MKQALHHLSMPTRTRGLHEITPDIHRWIDLQDIRTGLLADDEDAITAMLEQLSRDGLTVSGVSGNHLLVSCGKFGRLDRGRFTTLPGDALAEGAAAW